MKNWISYTMDMQLITTLRINSGFSKEAAIKAAEMYENGNLSEIEVAAIDYICKRKAILMFNSYTAAEIMNKLQYRILNDI